MGFLAHVCFLLNISIFLLLKVYKALPGSSFNSLLLNRYNCGNDYVGWHSDDEKLYGRTPEIASLTFVLKKKPCKKSRGMNSFVIGVSDALRVCV